MKRFKTTKAMTSFTSIENAEWAVSQVLKSNRLKIQMYSKAKFLLKRQRLVLKMDLNKAVGAGIMRDAPGTMVDMRKVMVIIEFNEYNHMPAYIVTAFPIP